MADTDDMAAEKDDPEAADRDAGEARGRHPAMRVLKWVGIAVAGLVILVSVAIALLDTGPGHRLVADQIKSLEFENGMKIEVGRIEGSIYEEMVLHDLSIKDPKGEFLFSPEVHVDWRPFAFLRDHVDVRSATAERMILRRMPEFIEVESDAPLLPDLDIDIGKLNVARFVIETPVTGEERVATISGKAHISDGRAQVKMDAATLADGRSAGGDKLAVDLDAVPEANRLAMDLDLDAPAGGVIAAMAGLSDALSVDLKGSGDWKAWKGKLAANLGTSRLANLDLAANDGTVSAKGTAQLATLAPEAAVQLLDGVSQIDLIARLDQRNADISGRLTNGALNATANGGVNLGENSFDQLKVALVLLRPSALAENLSGSGLRALLTLDEAFATPRVNYALNAARIVMNDMGLENLSATGDASINPDRILIPVNARASRITGLDTVAGGTLTNVALNGDIAIDGARVLSDNMAIRSDRIDAKAILLANLETGLYTGAIDGKIDNYRLESVGIFNIETDADLEATAGGGFALRGKVRARSTRLLNDSLQSYLGGNFVASSDVRYGGDGTVEFANLRLEAPDLRILGGRGRYSPDGKIALDATGTSCRYGKIGVQVAGTLENPQAHITADRPNFGIGLANLDARITGANGGYRFDVKGDTDYGPLTADVTLGTGRATSLTINSANLSGVDFAGKLTQTRAGPFRGKLTANGNGLGGIVQLDAQGRYQEAVFNLRAKDSVFSGPARLSIGSAIIDGRAVLYDNPYVVADAQFSETTYGDFRFHVGRVLVDYRDGSGNAKAMLEGTSGVPFKVALNAQMTPKLWRVALDGKARGIAFKTASPARIIPHSGTYELLPSRIDVGSGNIRLAGTYGNGMKIQSRMEKIDLAMVNAFVPGLGLGGSATGSFDFQQASDTAFPRADARLTFSNFTRTTAATVSSPVNINFAGKLQADGGAASAVIRRRGSVIGRMQASLRPLPPGAGPWMTRLMEAPLGGGIRYNGPAETLFSFSGQPGQNLTGALGIAANFSCRVSNPCLDGIVRGSKLTYVNETYGTRLSDLDFSGKFGGNRLEIDKLSAAAGDGTVTGNGYISLAADKGYPMDIRLDLKQARIARSDALSATATGDLRLTKTAGETALLSGTIRLPETRYKIVREGAEQVPQLTGVKFKPLRGPKRITGDEPSEPISSVFELVRLDIDVTAPERLYVSGMGMESEWRANFRVTGTSAQPRMAGTVELVRGTLGFAGRSFELAEGRIGFTGGSVIDPTVLIVATEDIDDIAVNVNVTGRSSDPRIDFSSVPGLPDDEILSRILFGSSVANLSAIQAVQLASSLNSLRGSGGGLNPLGKLRSATGIDRLRILGADEANGRGTALAAGQYLTDDIYVELITDARGFTATQLEVSITPWLSVLSQAGGSGTTNVNVKVRKNY